jgi:hypothetical protein
MRLAWLWFHRISTCIGLSFMLAEACAWTWCSIHAGHAINVGRFHLQFERSVFQVFDRNAAVEDAGQGNRKE